VDINRYAYSGNDPIDGSDPGGHGPADIEEEGLPGLPAALEEQYIQLQRDQVPYPGSAQYPAGTDPKFIKEYEAVKAQNQGWDPEWESKIVGNAQKTTDPWHAGKSSEIAEKAAKNPDVEKVYLNRSYNTSYSRKGISRERDDVTVVYKDGHVDHYERRSLCQTVESQSDKLTANRTKAGSTGSDTVINHPSADPNSRLGGSNGYKNTGPSASRSGSPGGGSYSGGLFKWIGDKTGWW
jgi:hypothetical protein